MCEESCPPVVSVLVSETMLCVHNMLCFVLCCALCCAGPPAPTPSSRQHASVLSPKASAALSALDDASSSAESWGVAVSEEDRAVWAAQEAMAERLPMVSQVLRHVNLPWFNCCEPFQGMLREPF